MIVYECIEIHPKDYGGWIIVMGMMNYCNGVQGFINFTTSIPKNFSGGGIRFPCRKCKNKKVSASKYYNDASSTQRVH
jgi:hypothetical protein